MDYYPNGSLEKYVKGRNGDRLNEIRIKSFAKQILTAMRDYFEKGVVHGNIKPENILIDEFNRLKIADFALFRVSNGKSKLSTTLRERYLSPELRDGEIQSIKSDIWAFGVVILELAYGRDAFRDSTIMRIRSSKIIEEFDQRGGYSERMSVFLSKCFVIESEERANLETLFQDDWIESLSFNGSNNSYAQQPQTRSDQISKTNMKALYPLAPNVIKPILYLPSDEMFNQCIKHKIKFLGFYEDMKYSFPYLSIGSNSENFYRLISEYVIQKELGNVVIGKLQACIEGNNVICLNMDYSNGLFSAKNEKQSYVSYGHESQYNGSELVDFKGINIEYFSLLLLLCDNIERMGFYGSIESNILGCGIDGEGMNIITQSIPFLKNVLEIQIWGKNDINIENYIGDAGCVSLFSKAKYLNNLENLYIISKIVKLNRLWSYIFISQCD